MPRRYSADVMKTNLKARYQLSDFLRAERNDRMTSILKRWIKNRASDKGDLEENSYLNLYFKTVLLLYLGLLYFKREKVCYF